MSSESDGGSEMEVVEDREQWKTVEKGRKNKRKRTNEFTQEEITKIILGDIPQSSQTKTKEINSNTKNKEDNNSSYTSKNPNSNKNYSPHMNEIKHKKYKHLYFISTDNKYTRIQFTDLWGKIYPKAKDIIIQTKKGFILKTDSSKESITHTLNKMVESGRIQNFQETEPNSKPPTSFPAPSYSVIITAVEPEIEDKTISDVLNKCNMEHRYCKRIISRTNNKPTTFIRIITGSQNTFETLLSEGLFFKYRHYPVYPSRPPLPTPKPCNKCLAFDHTTESCNTPIKCSKCFGPHSSNKCSSTLSPKCTSCGSEEHQAWSFKCPNRPKAPIEGIPNIQIKTLNKKSQEISTENRNSRIHTFITIHDHIINTYINEINEPTNTNREELLIKLRKRFMINFNVDTTAVFSGNRVYILIFEMERQDPYSPTEPINKSSNIQHEYLNN